MSSRENASLWGWIIGTSFGPPWRKDYFWHDSFGKYWNRYVKCKFFKHKNIKNISENNDYVDLHCFDCEGKVVLPLFFGLEPVPAPQFDYAVPLIQNAEINFQQNKDITVQANEGEVVFQDSKVKITASEIVKIKRHLKYVLIFLVSLIVLNLLIFLPLYFLR